jgi:hypothetical protein
LAGGRSEEIHIQAKCEIEFHFPFFPSLLEAMTLFGNGEMVDFDYKKFKYRRSLQNYPIFFE